MKIDWRIQWGVAFLSIAVLFNLIHYAIFNDGEYIGKFVIAQLGFLPISVFLVTVVLNQLLAKRERLSLLNKMNMVIGAFYSELGNNLLTFIDIDEKQKSKFQVGGDWDDQSFKRAMNLALHSDFKAYCKNEEIEEIKNYLLGTRDFLLTLLANPNLLEHDSFTEVLWAVLHLTEELSCRSNLKALPSTDLEHLQGDMHRAFKSVLLEWLNYMQHLQKDYPYLFSLAVRMSPFDPDSQPEVK